MDDYLSPKPAGQSIVPCPLGSKAQRVAQRKQKISQAQEKIKTMPPGTEKTTLENATSRFEFNNKAVERARLAENAYAIGQGEPPAGWKRVSADKIVALGLNPDNFPQSDPFLILMIIKTDFLSIFIKPILRYLEKKSMC